MYFDYFHSQLFPPKSLNILPPTPNFMYCFFFFSDPPSTICVVRIMGVKLFIYQGTQPLKKKKTDSPSQRSHQLSLLLGWSGGS